MARNSNKRYQKQASNQDRKVHILRQGQDAGIELPLKLREYPVCWGIPMDEVCFSLWFSNFMHLPIMPWDDIAISLSTYLPEARNYIHNVYLEKMAHVEYLVMLDSDVMPPPDFLNRLISHGKKMVGGWYRKKGGNNEPVVYDQGTFADNGKWNWHIRKNPGIGVEKVDAAGAGCWLMHRSVAEAIGRDPYDMNKGGEDLELCRKVREAGIDIWIDWDIACAHVGVGIT